MSAWFGASKKPALTEPAPAAPFEITCPCGNTLSGDRLPTHQFVSCAQCGQKAFVLPLNVYPLTTPYKPPSDAAAKSADDGSAAAREEYPDDLKPPVSSQAPIVKGSKAIGRKVKPPVIPITLPQDAPPPTPSLVDRWSERLARRLHSLRQSWRVWHTITASTFVVLAITGLILWRQAAISSARQLVDAATKAGIEALKRGEFNEADTQLKQAVAAFDLLGIHTDASRMVRQYAAEAHAAANLVETPFEEGLPELRGEQFSREWKESVRRHYAGKWLIFDSYAERDRASLVANRWKFDLPLQVAGRTTVVLLEPSSGKSFFPAGDDSARMILAGQIEEIELPGNDSELRIHLRGDTYKLWVHDEVLESLGLHSPDPDLQKETLDVLRHQTESLGLKE